MESSGIHVLRPAASKYPATTNCPTPSINPIDEQTVKRFQLTFAVPAIKGTTQATGPSKRAKIKMALPRFFINKRQRAIGRFVLACQRISFFCALEPERLPIK